MARVEQPDHEGAAAEPLEPGEGGRIEIWRRGDGRRGGWFGH
jgi:hypothetical protein